MSCRLDCNSPVIPSLGRPLVRAVALMSRSFFFTCVLRASEGLQEQTEDAGDGEETEDAGEQLAKASRASGEGDQLALEVCSAALARLWLECAVQPWRGASFLRCWLSETLMTPATRHVVSV